ncbi:MobV family relaxase [uncultured Alteromonas sp.]|jgi:hypothetical protein|uniref:MobV family relaxase n=1 Tax=uncultured Alteromonas sp. TaxID=179113 RepID=UPI0025878CE7|nr:MobV family relaxase [uncultured Alteromonas sp.]|tara:strand:- start:1604 stop:2446 length:843 start_codon:yes stop_codon:yes gene_type:complete
MDSKSPYAILRVEKVKSYAALAAMANHWFRYNPTPNADSNRFRLNKTIIGNTNIVDNVKSKLKAHGITKLRKNGVLALEFVLTFSPEFIYQNDSGQYHKDANQKLKKWIRNSLNWAKNEFGSNLVSAVIHLDESTPHLHLCILPIKHKKGERYGLCARDITGGKDKLQKLQDSYHNEMKSLGLQRGKKRSRCRHQTIKDYHNGIQTALRQIKEEGLSPPEGVNNVNPFVNSLMLLKSNYQNDVVLTKNKTSTLVKQLLKIIQELKVKLDNSRTQNVKRRI